MKKETFPQLQFESGWMFTSVAVHFGLVCDKKVIAVDFVATVVQQLMMCAYMILFACAGTSSALFVSGW